MGYQNANGGYLGPSTPIENVEPLIWHHYAVTREVGAGTAGYDKMKVYLNGVHQSGHDWEVITDGIVFGRDIDDDGVATDDYLYFGSDIGYYAGGWDLDQTAIFDETLNASQIAAKLADRTKLNLNDGTINKLGKALKKHNFIRLMRQGKPVYAVKEFTYEEVDAKNKEVEE